MIYLNNVWLVQFCSVPISNLKRTKSSLPRDCLTRFINLHETNFSYLFNISMILWYDFINLLYISAESHAIIVRRTFHVCENSSLWAQPDPTEKGRNIRIVANSDTWGFTDKTTIYRKLSWQFDVTVCSNKNLHYLGDFVVCETDSEQRRLEGNRWDRLTLPTNIEFPPSCPQKYIFFTFPWLQATLSAFIMICLFVGSKRVLK